MNNFEIEQDFNTAIINHLKTVGLYGNGTLAQFQTYTLCHKQAFMAVQLELTDNISESGILHDTDKLVLYGLGTLTKDEASARHRLYSRHHINKAITNEDLRDCIIDYECARFTKVDKPLNAYNTIMKYTEASYDKLKPTLQGLQIDSPTSIDIKFEKWNRMKNSILAFAFKKNIEVIDRLYNEIKSKGIDNSLIYAYSMDIGYLI